MAALLQVETWYQGVSVCILYCFEAGTPCVAQAGLELSLPASQVLGFEARARTASQLGV